MGSCVSKKDKNSLDLSLALQSSSLNAQTQSKKKEILQKDEITKKENVVEVPVKRLEKKEQKIQESKNEKGRQEEEEEEGSGCNVANGVRTSNCTKEEVDAILIQCGRLTRSSSSGNNIPRSLSNRGNRKFSGSKRSYDFSVDSMRETGNSDDDEKIQIKSSHRRTPSREKGIGTPDRKKSSSRDERRRNAGSRRASRSPGRKPEIPTEKSVPVKIISVPATVTVRQKNNCSRNSENCGKMTAKRASPRSQSPANMRNLNENAQNYNQPPTLSRSSSRKTDKSPNRRTPVHETDANIKIEQPMTKTQEQSLRKTEISPYRRTPICETDARTKIEQPIVKSQEHVLRKVDRSPHRRTGMNEIEVNVLKFESQGIKSQEPASRKTNKSPCRVPMNEIDLNVQKSEQPVARKSEQPNSSLSRAQRNRTGGVETMRSTIPQFQKLNENPPSLTEKANEKEPPEAKEPLRNNESTGVNATGNGCNPQPLTRTRSSRRSRDLDLILGLNPDTQNPNSYASLLLEDLQNYHQQNGLILPPCVSKACSILEAVADLNSCANSTFSNEKCSEQDLSRNSISDALVNHKFNRRTCNDPSMESQLKLTIGDVDIEQQESAGSNSFVGHHCPSPWELKSAASSDCFTSKSNFYEEVDSLTLSESGNNSTFSGKNRNFDPHRLGFDGKGRATTDRSRAYSAPVIAFPQGS